MSNLESGIDTAAIPGFSGMSERQQALAMKEIELNRKLDQQINLNITNMPKAVYFIIPNELCERFCFYGINPLLNRYYQTAVGLSSDNAKAYSHLFKAFTYFFPLIGAAVSDSYLGKYHTIVYFSLIYVIGNVLTSVLSIHELLGPKVPFAAAFVPLLLVSIGAGGIKPCVSSHGGDQFLSQQRDLMEKFFQLFYLSINVGALISAYLTPVLKNEIKCFGAQNCYFVAFGVPAIFFALALILFVAGFKFYRVVPPAREFLPWKALKTTFHALGKRSSATQAEIDAVGGKWLNLSNDLVGAEFVEETRLLGNAILVMLPICGFWMLYDQGSTEWQNQYEIMDKWIFNWFQVPTESFGNVNSMLIIIFVPILAYWFYPFMERRGRRITHLQRMNIGFILCIIAFVLANLIQYKVESDFAAAKAAGGVYINPETESVEKCEGCMKGLLTIFQWIILSLGEAFLSPTGVMFSYTQVGPQMKASSSSIWLLTSSLGNEIVFGLTFAMTTLSSTVKMWIFVGIGVFFWALFTWLSTRFQYIAEYDDEKRDEKN
ncbi:PTR2-domain-containing protein [Conidiobolus coronatus NRRL 28638]|uniref:PTR2-domain-containing protein n=1 Tax=Conidiobolus coronatus (strain ATCC 28846 / CBS 209.66 / NRRL 28638) TaxID=796925 RepID=A0A137P1M1_CONC2|nr:PTR2-domain-containing protein [Conidiobolus coronatus NRRL 28638]|eukprot:KXN68937.1 PTR2-domain-containing protein [Conidiobolus coronatus NRRL 28638]